jgi:hypothetical protein
MSFSSSNSAFDIAFIVSLSVALARISAPGILIHCRDRAIGTKPFLPDNSKLSNVIHRIFTVSPPSFVRAVAVSLISRLAERFD